jgi:hypothetical protein
MNTKSAPKTDNVWLATLMSEAEVYSFSVAITELDGKRYTMMIRANTAPILIENTTGRINVQVIDGRIVIGD